MNGFVKSPWKWNEIFEMCSKFLLILEMGRTWGGAVTMLDIGLVEELHSLSATEADEIYLNTDLINNYYSLVSYIYSYERIFGEIEA